MEQKKQFTGLSQYKVAFCYELAGRHFHLVMDSGERSPCISWTGNALRSPGRESHTSLRRMNA